MVFVEVRSDVNEHFLSRKFDFSDISYAFAAAKSLQSCPTLCDPIDSSLPGSAVPGVLQARTLEWVAIYFSNDFTEGLIAGAGKAEVGGGWRLEKVVKRQVQQVVMS